MNLFKDLSMINTGQAKKKKPERVMQKMQIYLIHNKHMNQTKKILIQFFIFISKLQCKVLMRNSKKGNLRSIIS